ncbi:MAG: hypothetical protein HY094_10565 [Candidatus Melainabacteria bacterium]|nr:hypothetical protein [Candidatus Melainabacteria bacterium]
MEHKQKTNDSLEHHSFTIVTGSEKEKCLNINSQFISERKSENKKLEELLEATTEEIIILLYQMEFAIFTNGSLPEEMHIKLEALKELILNYKKALGLPNPDKIDLPQGFIDEYSNLIQRANNVITETEQQIERLDKVPGSDFFIAESRIRLERLIALNTHYKRALELY